MYAARPLHDGIASNGILERCHDNVCFVGLRRLDCCIHVGHEVAGSFETEWIWNWRRETEHGERANRCEYRLPHRLAGRWGYCQCSLLGLGTAERCDDTIAEPVHVLRRDINMRCVVLRADSYGRRPISRFILRHGCATGG